MDEVSIIFWVGTLYVLLTAIGFGLLTRSHQKQAREIDRLNGEVVKAEADANHRYWQGYYACDQQWRRESLYQMGLEVGKQAGDRCGYTRGWAEAMEAATEMDVVRQSGELVGKVLD